MCFAEILLLYHLVIAQIHNDPLQGDLHPSNYHERKRRWGDAAHPGFHFHFLKLHTTHHIVHLTGASHYERPVDPRIEADVFEGLSSMVGGLRQRRNFVTTVILVMLALRPKQVKYGRSQELQGRHIQQVPPPTNIWRRHLLKYIFQPKKTADRPLDQSFNVRRNKWQICAAPL